MSGSIHAGRMAAKYSAMAPSAATTDAWPRAYNVARPSARNSRRPNEKGRRVMRSGEILRDSMRAADAAVSGSLFSIVSTVVVVLVISVIAAM